MDVDLSGHFSDMLEERGIRREWVQSTLSAPERLEEPGDETRHYIKRVPEFGNRWLRVVINVAKSPNKGVTAFFDRRLRKTHENQT